MATVDPKLRDYTERVAGYFPSHDIFYRDDNGEALILSHVQGEPTQVVSVMLGENPVVATVPVGGWVGWEVPA